MTRSRLVPIAIATLAALAGAAQNQLPPKSQWKPLYTTLPIQQKAPGGVSQKASSTATIPAWTYTTTSPIDGRTYSALMAGRSVTDNGRRTTSIPAYVVPIRMTIGGRTFDPTVSEACVNNYSVMYVVANSPVFTNAMWNFAGGLIPGMSQYADAYQRANFWNDTRNTAYHTRLQYQQLAARTVSVPSSSGRVVPGNCRVSGQVDIQWWNNYVTGSLLPALATEVRTDGVVVFQFASVVMYDSQQGSPCCILGYHSAVQTSSGIQTYMTANFDASADWPDSPDVSILSHEVAEWVVNPLLANTSPAWGHTGQEEGCSTALEVADPLSGSNLPVDAGPVTLYVQDLAFLSWFFRTPGPAAGVYSAGGTLRANAGAICR